MVSIHGRFGIRSWCSMILGALLAALGVVPLLNQFGVSSWTLPAVPEFALTIIFILCGIFLIWDATHEIYSARMFWILSMAFGLPILILGLLPILNQYGIIGFSLPLAGSFLMHLLTAVAGLVLFIDAWKSE